MKFLLITYTTQTNTILKAPQIAGFFYCPENCNPKKYSYNETTLLIEKQSPLRLSRKLWEAKGRQKNNIREMPPHEFGLRHSFL